MLSANLNQFDDDDDYHKQQSESKYGGFVNEHEQSRSQYQGTFCLLFSYGAGGS